MTTDSIYRPSGKRKGTHLNATELQERSARSRAAEIARYSHIQTHYHCPGREYRCAATLASIRFTSESRDTIHPGHGGYGSTDLVATALHPVAVCTCTQGHEQRLLLQ